jgi:hypothetical protein
MCLWDKNSQELRKSKRSSKKFPKEIMWSARVSLHWSENTTCLFEKNYSLVETTDVACLFSVWIWLHNDPLLQAAHLLKISHLVLAYVYNVCTTSPTSWWQSGY